MTELIKTISGYSCDVYTITGSDRTQVGTATPQVEVYEQSTRVPILGAHGINYKRTYLSVVICPDPEMSDGITIDNIKRITSFDLVLKLRRNDGVIVPVNLLDVVDADISDDEWRFTITNPDSVKRIVAM